MNSVTFSSECLCHSTYIWKATVQNHQSCVSRQHWHAQRFMCTRQTLSGQTLGEGMQFTGKRKTLGRILPMSMGYLVSAILSRFSTKGKHQWWLEHPWRIKMGAGGETDQSEASRERFVFGCHAWQWAWLASLPSFRRVTVILKNQTQR